jgi:hypothetical protein
MMKKQSDIGGGSGRTFNALIYMIVELHMVTDCERFADRGAATFRVMMETDECTVCPECNDKLMHPSNAIKKEMGGLSCELSTTDLKSNFPPWISH